MEIRLIKIGRAEENDIVLDHDSVSRFHLELFRDDEGNIFITDLSSTNGTTINGSALKGSRMLKKNDVVKLAGAKPLPWQSYFKDEQPKKATDVLVTKKHAESKAPTTKSRKTAIYWIAALVVVGLIVAAFMYYGDWGNTKNDSTSDTEKSESVTPSNRALLSAPVRNIPQSSGLDVLFDYSCMESDIINATSDLETALIDMLNYPVSLEDEMSVGAQLYEGCLLEYAFVEGARLEKIQEMEEELVAAIKDPRGFDYSIYLIESDAVNAFTAGGYIFVTTAMYDFVNNDDELACVIGHEIAHNECEHINSQLSKQLALRDFLGEYFDSSAEALEYFLTTPFNQKRETECDFHGIDYAVDAGYDACEVIGLWERMSSGESESGSIDVLLRTHPYSSVRSTCCRNHIESNYNFICE